MLADLYKNASSLVLVSTSETWGMVANEAQELGKPVICTEACGCANDLIIDGFTGLVIKRLDDSTERERIKHFLDKLPLNAAKYHENSLRNSKIFEVDKLASEMYQGFRKLTIN